ncbi:MAG: FG-GAP-like repeat-containing protein [Planctomycetota bacterium]|nr:FG-GAP-like repeat-containing protein [Planctomycetota bacterium]MDA1213262.1 FG-GAP-like repeat-containing protein [Planctomycetota bacterium]
MKNDRTTLLVSAAIITVVVAIVVGRFVFRSPALVPAPQSDPAVDTGDDEEIYADPLPEFSREETKRLLSLHHRGLGLLENGEYDKSEPLLAEVTKKYPDPATLTNLAICQILSLGSVEISPDDAEKNAVFNRAQETIDLLMKSSEASALPYYIKGRLITLTGDLPAAMEFFRKAAEHAPEAPVFPYAIYDAVKNSSSNDLANEGIAALRRTHDLVPDNLWIVCELLIDQLEHKDNSIVETLKQADEIFDFLKIGIRKRTRLDLDVTIDAALEALSQNDWPSASAQIRRIVNVVRPEVAVQLDRGKAMPHLLEFSVQFIGLHDYPEPPQEVIEDLAFNNVSETTDEASLQIPGLKNIKLIDFDLDGNLDIVAATEHAVHVLLQTGEATTWTSASIYESPYPFAGLLFVDLDRDTQQNTVANGVGCATADVDIVTFGPQGVQVLLNALDNDVRRLIPVVQNEAFQELRNVLTVAAVDFDHEGDLDLVISSDTGLTFWTNLGNMQFEKLDGRAGLPPTEFRATHILPVDVNRDLTLDLFLRSDKTNRSGRMINLRHGEFVWQGFDTSFATTDTELPYSIRALIADVGNDGRVDLLIGGSQGIYLYEAIDRSPADLESPMAYEITTLAVDDLKLWDYDNDGPLDLIACTDDGIKIWHGARDKEFTLMSKLIDADATLTNVQLVDVGDIDNDGDIDVAAATDERIVILRNDGGNQNNWLDVALRAQATPDRPQERVNIHGLGSRLEVFIGEEYMTRIVTEPITHFGLGMHESADVVRLHWPNGLPYNVIEPKANMSICEEQRLLSSCAFLYAWNGERFEFITDLLWNAPIGLPISEGVYIPPREWEYLHLSSDQLQPRDGYYTLQVTEELWEAAYFDEIELIAVDHPAEIELVSNEKVGPPSVAGYKLHTVGDRRIPIRAVNHQGRDLLPEVLNEDGLYTQPFDRRIKQGLVDEHFIELDLGDLDSPKNITLFLRGWMYPTGPSVNIAISQNPDITPPKPPALSVPDANGEWKEVIPFTGFPGGKTKTIAIDLSQTFLTDDYRLRLSTNMEFYWDAIYFTVDEPVVNLTQTVLPIESAELHFRGLSNMTPDLYNGPEHFDYNSVITDPFWPPMEGKFTRFGDVKNLLTATDDKLLVMGAGDEVTIRWKVPETPLPSGWKRDFILHNVGWNKDDDLNTAYGHQVEPLPFVGMEHYPYDVIPERLQSPDYLRYLKTYQTRSQSGRYFGSRP